MSALRVAVVGNPNVGKTSLFNQITGARHSVGNYPGMTVERREGQLAARWSGSPMTLVDLPGTYSLSATSEDEAVAFRALQGRDAAPPEAVLLVLDATHLARNLYFALQVLELGLPTVVALNMVDAAKAAGLHINARGMSEALGVAVIETVGRTGVGVEAVVAALRDARVPSEPAYPAEVTGELEQALAALSATGASRAAARWLVCSAASSCSLVVVFPIVVTSIVLS